MTSHPSPVTKRAPGVESIDRLVVLCGGVSVAAPAYQLLLDFEARGISVDRTDDARLLVWPAEQLTDSDRLTLRNYKSHLIVLLDYLARPNHLLNDHSREVV